MSSVSLPLVARYRGLLVVLGAALLVRVVFGLLIAGTYDYDEFVILLLGRDYAAGAVPYRDFMFFHPPGVLVLFRALTPLLSHWWQAGRLLSILVDTATTGLVWALASATFDRRTASVAAMLYALNPLALISAVRVGQDPLITMLGTLGLVLLLRRPGTSGLVLAGLCLAVAVWIKYPAVYFVPIYVLAAPRRGLGAAAVAALGFLVLLLPFHPQWNDLYQQTVTFQRTRWHMVRETRLWTVFIYWILVNPLAIPGVLRAGLRRWYTWGFLLGGGFLLSAQVYYHYLVPVAPFAALLSAPVAMRLLRRPLAVVALVGGIVNFGWAALIDYGGPSPLYVTAAHLADIRPTIVLITRDTSAGSAILADRYEYPYLAHRLALAHYFWNVGVLVNAKYLEQRLPHASAAVMSYGASSGFPAGTTNYLDRHFRRLTTPANAVWLRHKEARPDSRTRGTSRR